MPISWDSLGTTVGINVGVAVAVFFIFNYLRRIPVVADYYAAKRKLSLPFRFRPPRLPPTTFTWMVPVFTMPDEQFAACAGYDALTYVKFLQLCLRLTFWVTIIVGITVLPTNWAAGTFIDQQLNLQDDVEAKLKAKNASWTIAVCDVEIDAEDAAAVAALGEAAVKPEECDELNGQLVVTSFDKTSMSNIDAETKRSKKTQINYLWVHLCALWMVTLMMMKLLWKHWEEALKWRIVYLAETRKDDAAHTVLVTDIPGTPQGTLIGRIYDNINGTIGFLLPASFKAKVKQAMEKGVGKVFGAITNNKVAGALAAKPDLFKDRNYNVYRRPGDRAIAAASAAGGPYRSSVEDFADPEAGFFDAASQNGSFMSAVEGSVYGTPRTSMREGSMGSLSLPGGMRDEFPEAYPDDEYSVAARPPIAGRRNLRNWRFQKPRTDFEIWEQAENALQNGVTVQELVRREFASGFGAQSVRCVTVLKNEIELNVLNKKYEKEKQKLEDLTDGWISLLRRKKPIKRKEVTIKPNKKDASHTKKWGLKTIKADEMEYRLWLVQDCLEKLKVEQEAAKGEETSAAFVTMSTRIDQTTVATGMLSFREDLWVVDNAPEPTEVIWKNVAYRGWERGVRSLIAWGIFITMVIFMLPIITFITQIVNLEAYAEKPGAQGAWARWIVGLPFLSQVLPGILPTLGLKIFLALVPIVLTMSAVLVAGLPSESAVDFDVGHKFFIFQFIVVFLFITIIQAMSSGGGDSKSDELPIFALGRQLFDKPAQIPTWLGTSIPQVVPTYLQYILVNGVLAKGIAFLRLPGVAIFYILSKLSGTKRQKKRLWSQQYMQYGPELADHTITMLLVCVFCLMQPFIPLVALIYFVCNYFYARYDLLYSKREAFQSGGLFWPVIFDQIYLGMFVMLIGYFALFGIKKFALGTALTIPLIILLVMFRAAVHKTFKRPMEVLSLHAAADLDRADKKPSWQITITPEEEQQMADAEWDLEEVKFGPVEERYMQPSLIVDEYAHRKTLDDAQDVAQRVDTFNSGGGATAGAFMLDDDMSDVSDHTDIGGRGSVRASEAGPVLLAGHIPLSKKQENAA